MTRISSLPSADSRVRAAPALEIRKPRRDTQSIGLIIGFRFSTLGSLCSQVEYALGESLDTICRQLNLFRFGSNSDPDTLSGFLGLSKLISNDGERARLSLHINSYALIL